ncbi:MAG TPA: response regulator transcription factor [Sedimentibacter sp.]|nr:response regulator transcription factor [Sedimentibacter sp.]
MLTNKEYEKLLHFQSQLFDIDGDIRQKVLELMQNLYNGYSMAFFLTDENGQYIDPVSVNIDTETMDSYKRYYFKTDIFHTINISKNLLSRNIVHITDIMPLNNFEKTEFYADVLRKMGVYDEIALHLQHNGQLLGVIGIMKPKCLGRFTENEIRYASVIQENVTKLLKDSLEKLKFRYENGLIMNYIQESPIGMMILDSNFNITHYNQFAVQFIQEILGSNCDTYFNDKLVKLLMDKMYFKEFTFNTSLQACIQDYFIKIIPLVVPDYAKGLKTFYALYISKNDNNSSINYNNLKVLYNLTNRECEIISMLLQGYSNQRIADELYLSNHTVKTHMQNIFKKMNCLSRTEVVYKVLQNNQFK